jgi:hypothetical protein
LWQEGVLILPILMTYFLEANLINEGPKQEFEFYIAPLSKKEYLKITFADLVAIFLGFLKESN